MISEMKDWEGYDNVSCSFWLYKWIEISNSKPIVYAFPNVVLYAVGPVLAMV